MARARPARPTRVTSSASLSSSSARIRLFLRVWAGVTSPRRSSPTNTPPTPGASSRFVNSRTRRSRRRRRRIQPCPQDHRPARPCQQAGRSLWSATRQLRAGRQDLPQLRPARSPCRQEHAEPVEAILGLDSHPIAKPHFRILDHKKKPTHPKPTPSPAPTPTASGSFNPPQVAQFYSFPTGVTGSGPDHRHHRTRRRLQRQRPQHLLQRTWA
jgi:hypothetical protein